MSKQRIVKDEIWNDDWFYQLPHSHKLVWLFLLTNDRNNVAGLYKLNYEWASKMLGVKKDTFDSILEDFEGSSKVVLVKGYIQLVNSFKHQSRSPKITAGIKRILADVPKEVLETLYGIDTLPIGYRTLLNLTLLNLTLPNGVSPDGIEEMFEEKKFGEEDLRLAKLLAELIQQNNPDWQMRGKIETWAEHIEKLRRIDGRSVQQIEYMIRWTQAHDFWQANILSTEKLRKKFNDLIPQVKREAVNHHKRKVAASKPKMV